MPRTSQSSQLQSRRDMLPRPPHPAWLGEGSSSPERRSLSAAEFWQRLDP